MKLREIKITTDSREQLVDITEHVRNVINDSGILKGLCTIYIPHTTAGVTINENADPTVALDIIQVFQGLVPQQDSAYRHSEGNSDAHIKASLIGSSVSIGIENGNPILGTWQGIFFAEFDGPRSRRVHIFILSTS